MKATAIFSSRSGWLYLSTLLLSIQTTAAFLLPTADVSLLHITKTRDPFLRIHAVRDEVIDVPANDAFSPSADASNSLQQLQEQKGELRFGNAETIVSQVKSLDKNTIINTSIFAIALVTVVFQVLSVDVGITRGWSTEEIAYRVPLDNWNSYNAILAAAPIQTKSITSATVYAIGDTIAQRTEGTEIGELDRGRIVRSLAAGLIGHGPLSHFWYQISEDFFNNVLMWTDWWSFIPKVVIDQTLWGPFWNNSYIVLLGVMQFQKPSQVWADIKRTTIPLVVSGLKLWPLAHCITYGFVPVENRLLWVDMVEIVWVTILATQAAGSVESNEAAEKQEQE
mmetsp:Transcript_8944/g.13423  ORF Transcript_8944/g.13423 Transcript_8944/m.13423 type:complete len:338 (+) Transcript_8944:109-1122(+)